MRPGWPQVGSLVTSLAGSTALIAPIAAPWRLLRGPVTAGRSGPLDQAPTLPCHGWISPPPSCWPSRRSTRSTTSGTWCSACRPWRCSRGRAHLACRAHRPMRRETGLQDCRDAVGRGCPHWPSSCSSLPRPRRRRKPSVRRRPGPTTCAKCPRSCVCMLGPGDAALYIAANSRTVSQGYPRPFHKLRDIALASHRRLRDAQRERGQRRPYSAPGSPPPAVCG